MLFHYFIMYMFEGNKWRSMLTLNEDVDIEQKAKWAVEARTNSKDFEILSVTKATQEELDEHPNYQKYYKEENDKEFNELKRLEGRIRRLTKEVSYMIEECALMAGLDSEIVDIADIDNLELDELNDRARERYIWLHRELRKDSVCLDGSPVAEKFLALSTKAETMIELATQYNRRREAYYKAKKG